MPGAFHGLASRIACSTSFIVNDIEGRVDAVLLVLRSVTNLSTGWKECVHQRRGDLFIRVHFDLSCLQFGNGGEC